MPVTLTIDGREVEVEQQATVLEAARKLGIEIPTMCHRDGVEPVGSCFVCVVEVAGRPDLVPSCALRVEEGMVVTTDSSEIRAARKVSLELLLSDHTGDCVAPCTLACPAGLDIPGFLWQIEAGSHRQALAVIKESIPFPGTLGRICARYCERVCRRRESDQAIAICALKRFAADVDVGAGEPYVPPRGKSTGRRVAVVGAGPAGLSATYYLLQAGHACTVFDARPEPGGAFRYAIPEFRLPAAVVDAEVDVIRRLGAEFRMKHRLGQHVTLEELRREHDAVFLALGAPREAPVEFAGAQGARSALEFLGKLADGTAPQVGDSVVVVGGGNEALDAARTAVRLGAKRVTLVCEKSRSTLSAFKEYVDAALEEGVTLELEAQPVKLESVGGGRFGLTCTRADEAFTLDASLVLAAPARVADRTLIESMGLKATNRGVSVDRRTLATELTGVFAGGEVVSGPGPAVRAVAGGRLAALSIGQYLAQQPLTGAAKDVHVVMGRLSDTELASFLGDVKKAPRVSVSVVRPERRRRSFEEVQQGLTEEQAQQESARCLQCDCLARDDCKLRRLAREYGAGVASYRGEARPFERDTSHPLIVYESGKCILCGLCVRLAEQAGEALGMSFTRRGFAGRAAVPFGGSIAEGLSEETARLCAQACPTGALALKRPRPSARKAPTTS